MIHTEYHKQEQLRELAFLAKQKVRKGDNVLYWTRFIQDAHKLLFNTLLDVQVIVNYLNNDRTDLFFNVKVNDYEIH